MLYLNLLEIPDDSTAYALRRNNLGLIYGVWIRITHIHTKEEQSSLEQSSLDTVIIS